MSCKIFSFLFCVIGSIGFAQIYNDENPKLKGKTKSVDLSVIEYRQNEKFLEKQTFDVKGRILVEKKYSDGQLRSEERNEYQPNQIITTTCQSCNDFDKIFSQFSIRENQKYPYSGYVTNSPSGGRKIYKRIDSKGNVVSEKFYSAEGYLLSNTKKVYDKTSKITLTETFDDENKLTSYRKYVYNKNGLILEDINKNEMQPESISNYSYDNLGRKTFYKNNYANRIFTETYEYSKVKDTAKTLTYSAYDNEEKKLKSIEITYPKLKNTIKEKQRIIKDKIQNRIISEYDENKRLMVQKFYNEKNELIRETHTKYDTTGNWVEINLEETVSVRYNNDPPKMELQTRKYLRKIEYY